MSHQLRDLFICSVCETPWSEPLPAVDDGYDAGLCPGCHGLVQRFRIGVFTDRGESPRPASPFRELDPAALIGERRWAQARAAHCYDPEEYAKYEAEGRRMLEQDAAQRRGEE